MVNRKYFTLFIMLILIAGVLAGIGILGAFLSFTKAPIFLGLAALVLGFSRLTIGEKVYSNCIEGYEALE